MNQKGLIYSFVAKGTVVLAEHTSYSGNFSTIAVQCLQRLPSNSSKYTYSCDGHTFNFLLDSGFGIFFSSLLSSYEFNFWVWNCVVKDACLLRVFYAVFFFRCSISLVLRRKLWRWITLILIVGYLGILCSLFFCSL